MRELQMADRSNYKELKLRLEELEDESAKRKLAEEKLRKSERELSETVRKLQAVLSHAPLVLSAVNSEGVFICCGFIQKPFALSKLSQTIDEILARK